MKKTGHECGLSWGNSGVSAASGAPERFGGFLRGHERVEPDVLQHGIGQPAQVLAGPAAQIPVHDDQSGAEQGARQGRQGMASQSVQGGGGYLQGIDFFPTLY